MTTVSPISRSMAELALWLDRHQEEVIEPERPIIDAHHHLWLRPPEAYQLAELTEDTGSGHDIRASVFVQCTAMYREDGPVPLRPVGETEYINGMAAISASGLLGSRRLCAGIVGYADLRLGTGVRPVLEAHLRAAGDRFKGIRQQAQNDPHVGALAKATPPARLLGDEQFLAGFACLAPLGLSFDAWTFFTQIDDIATLAARFPETRIIVNHLGGPLGIGHYASRRDEVFAQWARGMLSLSCLPNVFMKIGGMGMASFGAGFADRDVPASSIELANAWNPYVDVCLEAFGASRCMFESNFPVDKQSCSYRTLWNAFKRMSGALSHAERHALFYETAKTAYRLTDIA